MATEVCILLERRRGTYVELAFVSDVRKGRYTLIESLSVDPERVAELVAKYDLIVCSRHYGNCALPVRTLAKKGVVRLLSARPWSGEDSEIRISAVETGGPAQLDWSALDLWLTEFLISERMRGKGAKLLAIRSPERHAFIGLSCTTPWPVYHALCDDYRGCLPSRDPTLPPEITHLWLCAEIGRCIAWFPDRGWFELMRHWVTD